MALGPTFLFPPYPPKSSGPARFRGPAKPCKAGEEMCENDHFGPARL